MYFTLNLNLFTKKEACYTQIKLKYFTFFGDIYQQFIQKFLCEQLILTNYKTKQKFYI